MLVYYDNHEEALTVLTNYAYDATFPPNPNAYVYLYKFLKEHDPSARNLMKVLKVTQHTPFFFDQLYFALFRCVCLCVSKLVLSFYSATETSCISTKPRVNVGVQLPPTSDR